MELRAFGDPQPPSGEPPALDGATGRLLTHGSSTQPPPSRADVEYAVARANEVLQTSRRTLTFVLDGDFDQPIVKVVEAATGEVVRQIPNEEVVAISKAIRDMQGLLLRARA